MALALSLGLALAACGDDSTSTPIDAPINPIDAGTDAPTDAGIDADNTFTAFVIDQIQNHTVGTTDPVPYANFSTLNDPDLTNPAAYAPLFP